MSGKFFLYIIVTILVIWAMDSVNINQIFKKNKIIQARVFYFLLGISLIYLVTNFIMDLFMLCYGWDCDIIMLEEWEDCSSLTFIGYFL